LRHPPPVIEIRGARPEDESALVQVDAATWTVSVSPAPPPPTGTAFFSERVRPEDVLVAVVNDAVVGYVRLGQPTLLASHAHVLEISGLAVHPDRQRDGIGRHLVEAAVREARDRDARKLILRVLGPNTAARCLYEANEFVVEGVLHAEFFLEGAYVDDVLMARHLADPSTVP
jgi:ribosomal protein S18 acetylase RimI-like enzyme